LALADTVSLALCGELKAPLVLPAPGRNGDAVAMRLVEHPGHAFGFALLPWPFRKNSLTVEGEARPLPPAGRLSNETAMRSWLASADRVVFSAQLTPG